MKMTLAILATVLVVLAAQLYLPPFPSKLPSLQQIWKNIYESFVRTDLTKLAITDETVSNDEFTFYYPVGYIKDEATSVRGTKLRTQLIARYYEPRNTANKYYQNSIALEKILDPTDLSSEEKCGLLVENAELGSHKFNKGVKITTCIIELQYSSRESTYESTITEYFYKKDHGDAYKITTTTRNDQNEEPAISLKAAAEKFELKN